MFCESTSTKETSDSEKEDQRAPKRKKKKKLSERELDRDNGPEKKRNKEEPSKGREKGQIMTKVPSTAKNSHANFHSCKSSIIPTILVDSLAVLVVLMVISTLLPAPRANPMFCQTSQGRTLWKIPAPPKCEYKSPTNQSQTRIPTTLQLYKRNEIQYKTTGYHCKKVKQTIKTFVYFFNDERIKEEFTDDVPVSKAECDQMRKWKICEEGKLIEKGGLLQTDLPLNWEYSGGGAWCCHWKTFQVTNCFAYKVFVYKRHRSTEMQSTAGNAAHCTYKDGACNLRDNSALIWDVNLQEHCQYLPWKAMSGDRLGSNWIATDHNLALTWSSDMSEPRPRSCNGKALIMSQQGIPFRIQSFQSPKKRKWMKATSYRSSLNRRLKRRTDTNDHGYVTTELLAGTLQAVATEVAEGVQYAYSHALTATCQNMRQLHNLLRALIYANPIMAARALLSRDNIYAHSGGELLEIWPCEAVESGTYTFLSMNNTCTVEIPLKLNHSGGPKMAYMNPKTGILQSVPTVTDCSLENEIPFTQNNQSWLYHRKTGDAHLAKGQINSLEFYHPEVIEWLPWKATVYHQIIMYNFSELQSSISLNDIYSSLDRQKQILTALGVKKNQAPMMQWEILPTASWNMDSSDFSMA